MNRKDIATKALNYLQAHTGVTGRWTPLESEIDGEIDLLLENRKLRMYTEVKNELRSFQLPRVLEMAEKYQPLLVVADRIFPQLKVALRQNRVGYLDGAGNLYINIPDQFIWIDGHKHPEVAKPVTNRAFTKTGLKAVFYLLVREDHINLSYRDLAKATKVALGNINNIMAGLKDAGFVLSVDDRKMVLQNKRGLLERWIAGYKETLKPSLHIGNFRFVNQEHFRNWGNLPVKPGVTIWGAEPAARLITGYLNPGTLTIYTSENKGALMAKWRLVPDHAGNVSLYEKFWSDWETDNLPYAPILLVYADLLLTDDPRCIETAERIYNQYLKDEFERY